MVGALRIHPHNTTPTFLRKRSRICARSVRIAKHYAVFGGCRELDSEVHAQRDGGPPHDRSEAQRDSLAFFVRQNPMNTQLGRDAYVSRNREIEVRAPDQRECPARRGQRVAEWREG